MPSFVEEPIVNEFREIVYHIPIIIDFDWSHWEERPTSNFQDIPKTSHHYLRHIHQDDYEEQGREMAVWIESGFKA